jgi:hypothetical protein
MGEVLGMHGLRGKWKYHSSTAMRIWTDQNGDKMKNKPDKHVSYL